MRFSNILSKNVISLYDGSNEGIIISGYFDKHLKKLVALEIASNDDFCNESDNNLAQNSTQANTKDMQANEQILTDEFILYVKNIYTIGPDAVTIKNNANLELKITADNLIKFTPINCQAFSTNGKLLGRIIDIEMDDKFNIVSYLFSDNTCIEAGKIASHSKGTIIFYDEGFKTKVDKLRPNGKAQIRAKNAIVLKNSALPKTYILPTTPTPMPVSPQPEIVVNDFENSNINTNDSISTNLTSEMQNHTNHTTNQEENDASKPKTNRNFFTLLFKGKHNEENGTNGLQKFEDNETKEKNANIANFALKNSTSQIPNYANQPNQISNDQFINLNPPTANSLQMQRPLTNANIQRLTANSNLLIGKKITRTIATQNGELIGKKGNLVTNKTIYLATAHQKLRELVLYCE